MRIWSVHPRYLDRQALIACWRETLLAQKVLAGNTTGYTRHPQLVRFKEESDPVATVGAYLSELATEGDARGYRLDRSRILHPGQLREAVEVTDGQLDYEWRHLMGKLQERSPETALLWQRVTTPDPHPLFRVVSGMLATWERP